MPPKQPRETADWYTNEEGVRISKRTGEPVRYKAPNKKPVLPPTKEELAKLSRKAYEVMMRQLEHTDDAGRPTAPAALFNTINQITKQTETVVAEETEAERKKKKKQQVSPLESKLEELRAKRDRNRATYAGAVHAATKEGLIKNSQIQARSNLGIDINDTQQPHERELDLDIVDTDEGNTDAT